ncbi:hypothetical protein N7448_003928 [Penicillium atrosanguineum]|uniref:Uncharacterized protein n=1 Tax=Penicillium atrosanguineum TaxID=1132637 RepID=A0A9W9L832_9EURO|nr:uncharacterized protein N7443_002894 [Penicillium atrosanguineum]KAJ5122796.1 hypothetical protein N7526_009733 [Penicillium atrosanguineum]KAJ5140520.1 hypothetical protein N7448_003928 [Penicillium atrosanguineum]KAJ5310433.1 hypothetical protein N7443_002894 [Penicillium atrosanguineum]KAJ5315953.1 hypothetical protein N7476_006260 [Penicillium atrosanguineum]
MSVLRERTSANPSGIPIMICALKPVPDDQKLEVKEGIEWPVEIANVQFYHVSSDTEGLKRPLLATMRQLVEDPNAEFEVVLIVDEELWEKYQEQCGQPVLLPTKSDENL